MERYRPRLVDGLIGDLLQAFPAILILGPRAVGKTTTAERVCRSVVHLDRAGEAAAFDADPDAALRALEEPVLLDEWQAVPGVLGAVKRAVDADPRRGRFVLTGSVRADLEAPTWAGTGRVQRVTMSGLTVREVVGVSSVPSVIDRLAAGGPGALTVPTSPPDLVGYVELAAVGAFPEPAFALSERDRPRWLRAYGEQLVTRDAVAAGSERDPVLLRRYFDAVALNTAGVVQDRTLYEAAGITAKTAAAYERLLAGLLVLDIVPAWWTNRLKRLVQTPKRYVVDPALVMATLRLDVAGVVRDGNVLGRIVETFVMTQLRAEATISDLSPRLHHLRTREGRHEVDILLELGGDRIIAAEVTANAAPRGADARHLAWLRGELGDRFLTGIVFHTGPRIFELGDRIAAVPIAALWGDAGSIDPEPRRDALERILAAPDAPVPTEPIGLRAELDEPRGRRDPW